MWYQKYKAQELKDVLAVPGFPLGGNKATLAGRIFENLDRAYEKPGATAVQLRVLGSWLLNPKFTGSKECTIGLVNEETLLSLLPAFLKQTDWDVLVSTTITSFTVSEVGELGL